MRRIGIYSDIHANLPALEAVLAHMHAEGITERYCLGDLIGYGPHATEVVARMRELGDPSLQGNYDRAVAARLHEPGSGFPTPQEALDGAESYADTISALGRDDERFLAGLPRALTLEADGIEIALCHGTPRHVSERVQVDSSGALLVSLAREAGVFVVCCGHGHVPFHRSIPTEAGVYHWVSAGSVGRPRDGDPRACWVELVIGAHADVVGRVPEDLSCRRIGETDVWVGMRAHRVAYDVEAVIRDMLSRGLPLTLASPLRTGSEVRRILAPTSTSVRVDAEVIGPDAEGEAGVGDAAEDGEAGPACEGRTWHCSCAVRDRITAYESFSAAFQDGPGQMVATLTRLKNSMHSCIKNPHIDDDQIVAAYELAIRALGTEEGRAAFAEERFRLYGECRRFDPFSHVLSASELTYLSGDMAANRSALNALYDAVGFIPSEPEAGCIGHISVECAFMAHCLRRGTEGASSLGAAREFFIGHLADWAVLFAVVTAQQAREPVMRYVGMALDKYLICEAATFRTAVPEYCEMRQLK